MTKNTRIIRRAVVGLTLAAAAALAGGGSALASPAGTGFSTTETKEFFGYSTGFSAAHAILRAKTVATNAATAEGFGNCGVKSQEAKKSPIPGAWDGFVVLVCHR
ncbi:hypothetical protein AB5J62_22790 [Amycolatopsis sp. cg5]|uniref:hypothetical protein n=1 Tax=Amycolatopsis sp. cg5 TaxID=3238802 RepID=UPI003524AA47